MIYLIIAIAFISLAHMAKILRQKQFIEIYEKPKDKYLMQGLSIGYALNLIFPLKLGTIFRIIYPGKKMKNGVSFSCATIIIDVILDFFTVGIIYLIMTLFKVPVTENLIHYAVIGLILIISFIAFEILKKYIKKIS